MNFYKLLSAVTIALLILSSNAFSMEIEDDSLFSETTHSSRKPLDKYENAIEICHSHSDSWSWYSGVSDSYENAMKVCGANAYRLSPITIQGIKISNSIGSYNYESLTKAELHHVAGDMMHIAKLAKDKSYREKVTSAMRYEFQKAWFEENANSYNSTRQIADLKIPDMPEECYNNNNDLCEAFIEMVGFFKRWEELQKASLKVKDVRDFFCHIKEKYKQADHSYTAYAKEHVDHSYDKASLLRYRKQRKLNLFWHPKNFSVYDSNIYSEARAREFHKASCQQSQPTSEERKRKEEREKAYQDWRIGELRSGDLDRKLKAGWKSDASTYYY